MNYEPASIVQYKITEFILSMGSANERRRYVVTSSLIVWAHTALLITRDHSVYKLSQWETMLLCNIVFHWLNPYTEWSQNQGQLLRVAEDSIHNFCFRIPCIMLSLLATLPNYRRSIEEKFPEIKKDPKFALISTNVWYIYINDKPGLVKILLSASSLKWKRHIEKMSMSISTSCAAIVKITFPCQRICPQSIVWISDDHIHWFKCTSLYVENILPTRKSNHHQHIACRSIWRYL